MDRNSISETHATRIGNSFLKKEKEYLIANLTNNIEILETLATRIWNSFLRKRGFFLASKQ